MSMSSGAGAGPRSGIRQVAERAGVSVGTVSRALRGQPGVADKTRQRVHVAAEELGYVPSPSAASLASGRTMTIGVVVPNVGGWFFGSVIHSADEVLSNEGYDVLLYDLAGREDARRRLINGHLLKKRVDGAVVVTLDLDAAERAALRNLHLPMTLVGGDDGFAGARIDDVKVGVVATSHLIDLGHRRIAFVGVDPVTRDAHRAAGDRCRGYRRVLGDAGITPSTELEMPGAFTVQSGADAMTALLRLDDPPTAVFAASDEMAMGCLLAARQAGKRVPEDLSVIGVDDHEMAVLHDLTTVAQPVTEEGRIAARLLLDLLTGVEVDTSRPVVVPTRLVVRGTTAPPCGDNVATATSGPALAAGRSP